MLKELAFSLKSVHHFIGETSDSDVVESEARKATPSPSPKTSDSGAVEYEARKATPSPPPATSSVPQQLNPNPNFLFPAGN